MSNNNERIEKLEATLEKIDSRLDSIDKTLDRNTMSLEIHMKRSDAIEKFVKEQIVEKDINPIKDHVNKVTYAIHGILWFCGVIAGVAGFVYTIKKIGLIP